MSESKGQGESSTVEIIDPSFELNMTIAFKPTLLPEEIEDDRKLENGESVKCEYRGIEKRYRSAAYVVKNGKPSGQYRAYHIDGTLKSECFYRLTESGESILHGPSVYVSTKGITVAKVWYVDGLRIGREFNYYHTGNLRSSIFYKDGLKEGKALYHYENGCKKTEMQYSKGILDSAALLYHDNGQLSRAISYQDGKKEGLEKEWSPNGKLIATRLFKKNILQEQQFWNARGVLVEKHVYLGHAEKADKWKWDGSGILRFQGIFTGDEYLQKEWDGKGKIVNLYSGLWNGETLLMRCYKKKSETVVETGSK